MLPAALPSTLADAVPTVLADAKFLVSFWKPIVYLIPLVGWAWVITRVYDKHAARFFLGREKWNTIHLSAGLIAVLAAFLMPIKGELAFWVGLATLIVILLADLLIYPMVANKDDRVPEAHRIKLNALAQMAKAREAKAAAAKMGKVELTVRMLDKTVVAPPQAETPEFEVRTTAESIVTKSLGNRATRIDVAPLREGQYGVAYTIDGMRPNPPEAMPAPMAVKVIDFWKSAAKLDINDRRRQLTGDVFIEKADSKTRLRVQSAGIQGGQRLSIVLDPERQVRKKGEDLGLLEPQFKALTELTSELKGLVLLSASAGQGRTTTLYSVLRMHDAYTNNIQTVELQPQDAIEGVRQNQFEVGEGDKEYSTYLRSILRRDPQVVGVGELPDEATAKEVMKADLERTRVYLSMRADSAVQAIQSYMKACDSPDVASKHLRGAVSQKLIRKLCTNCRVPYAPSPDMLKTLGIPAGRVQQLFKKGGQVMIKNKPDVCPVCQGIGYVGLEAAFEVYTIGAEERELIKAGNWQQLQAEFRKKGMPSLRQAAIAKVASGSTSVEELTRVTAEAKPVAPAAAKPAAAPAKPAAPKPPPPKK